MDKDMKAKAYTNQDANEMRRLDMDELLTIAGGELSEKDRVVGQEACR